MKKNIAIILLAAVFLTGCTIPEKYDTSSGTAAVTEPISTEATAENGCIPINYTKQIGLWLPYLRI